MGLASFFRVFLSLSIISHIPSVLTLAFLMMLIPGATLLGANSVLLYGLAFVPIYFANKYNHFRAVLYPAGLAAIAVLAFIPGQASERALRTYAARAADTDFATKPSVKPRSIQLVSEYEPRSKAGRCTELCQKLLFAAGIHEVVVDTDESDAPFRHYRLERRSECPNAVGVTDDAFRNRIRNGECLIGENAATADADVSIRETKAWLKSNLAKANNCSISSRSAISVIIGTIKRIDVEERREGQMQHVERRTGITGYVIPSPFYVGAVKCRGENRLATQLASEPKVVLEADVGEVLARRYAIDLDGPAQTSARSTAGTSVADVAAAQSR